MPKTITGSVGRGGRNFPTLDVMTVQYLLNCVPATQGGPTKELVVDGAAGPKTIAAIEGFQRRLGGFADGRVDPGGATLRNLQARANDPYPNQPLTASAAKGGQYPPAGKGGQYPAGAKGGQYPGGGKGTGNDPFGQKGGAFPPGGMPPGQWPGAKGGNSGGAKGF
jgi:peptidoglycan hydrolase-like protein with peptidoglycan-binding domain